MSSLVSTMLQLYQTTNLKYAYANQVFNAQDAMLAQANAAGNLAAGGGINNLNTPRFGRQSANLEAQAVGAGLMYEAADAMQQATIQRFNRAQQRQQDNIRAGLSLYA